MDKPPVIIADWDEDIGPIIVDQRKTEDMGTGDNNPEVLISRCYISAQSIFAREKFKKINFILPLITIDKLAIVFLDIVEDDSVRGGRRPFLLVIFLPFETRYGITDTLVEHIEPELWNYKNHQPIDLNLIQELTVMVVEKDKIAPSAPATAESTQDLQGELKLVIYECPNCGTPIYPEEVACTQCRLVIRTFCARCNYQVEKDRKYCPACGMPNLRFEEDLILKSTGFSGVDDGGEIEEMIQNVDAVALPRSTLNELEKIKRNISREMKGGGELDIEEDFNETSSSLADEINDLKNTLIQDSEESEKDKLARTKGILVESFTRDYTGNIRGQKDIHEQSLDESFNEPAVDEVHLLIKSMSMNDPTLSEKSHTRESRDKLLMDWDCTVYLHGGNKILIGLGSNPVQSKPVPGTLFITETSIIFFSYIENFEGIPGILSYFDGGIQYLENYTFSIDIADNVFFFQPHGIFQQKYPSARNIYLHFTWPDYDGADSFKNQSLILNSYLERLKMNPKVAPMMVGKYHFMAGKHPTDPAIRNILGDLQAFYPEIVERIKNRYPSIK
ncbi:MAG: zinc ribbon domain-containing protein [Promethearchaeota archaeon]